MLKACFTALVIGLVAANYGMAAGLPERQVPDTRKVTTVDVDPETGRLVRVRPGHPPGSHRAENTDAKRIAQAREIARKTPNVDASAIQNMIEEAASRHGMDSALVHSVIRVESNYHQKAISPKGAQGLMQLIPATAQRYGVENPFDPQQNLDGGVRYLKYLTERFRGNLRLALAAYNAGEGAVDRHRGVPPYQETQQYVTKVARELEKRGGIRTAQELASPAIKRGVVVDEQEDTKEQRFAPLRMYTDAEGRLHIENVSQ